MSLLERLQGQKEQPVTEQKLHNNQGNRQEQSGESVSVNRKKINHTISPVPLKKPSEEKVVYQPDEKMIQFKNLVHKEILKEIKGQEKPEEIVEKIEEITTEVISENDSYRTIDRSRVITDLVNDLTGFGPINPLLNDEDVSEVMVNGPNQVYCERNGKLELTDVHFRDDEHVLHVIEKIVAPLGRRIDESSPMVDARLPDGSRVN